MLEEWAVGEMKMASIPDVGYTYSAAISRRPIRWPKGQNIAVIITVNLEHWTPHLIEGRIQYPAGPNIIPMPIPQGVPDFVNYTWREYGQRVGIWRIMDVLDKHGVRASATLNSDLVKKCPEIISEAKKRDWEFLAHSDVEGHMLINHANEPEAERELIRKTARGYEEAVGSRPLGWLSPAVAPTFNTLGILADEGFRFFCDFINDDQPYPLRAKGKMLVSIPYSVEINDYMLFIRQSLGREGVFSTVKEFFDVLYDEGSKSAKIMNIGLHPHVIGQPHRIGTLNRMIEYMKGKPNVWFPKRIEIADWYEKNYT